MDLREELGEMLINDDYEEYGAKQNSDDLDLSDASESMTVLD